MGLEESVRDFIKDVLDEEHYCTKHEANDISQLIAEDLYTKFSGEMAGIRKEVDTARERENRIWDILHEKPPPKCARLRQFWVWLRFWRR